jgi:hypothetical protein
VRLDREPGACHLQRKWQLAAQSGQLDDRFGFSRGALGSDELGEEFDGRRRIKGLQLDGVDVQGCSEPGLGTPRWTVPPLPAGVARLLASTQLRVPRLDSTLPAGFRCRDCRAR